MGMGMGGAQRTVLLEKVEAEAHEEWDADAVVRRRTRHRNRKWHAEQRAFVAGRSRHGHVALTAASASDTAATAAAAAGASGRERKERGGAERRRGALRVLH